ncbi:F-type ATPase subunit delta [Limihaloglobus sulfuriphilus]|uniref:ATP synthase subunit delta n=1 Tax=Limihaloglobus sulfuriphilus TaxID=1851148 RepID=A0A1Q2MHK6_9BACT|nr:ATP synthase F1 subunit delta [Limihaloglobus sulfuriphilus]AQQ72170.1 F-type ATPase subunit delta [Limihaloglobus sulfuriphilus]
MQTREINPAACEYAAAAFELSCENNSQQKDFEQILAVREILSENSEFQSLLCDPFEKPGRLIESAMRVFEKRISETVMGLLAVLIKNRRMNIIGDIAEEYEKLFDKDRGISRITVTLANAIGDDELEGLKTRFEKACGGEVKLKVLINPSILGGIIIEQDDILIDNSVRSFLAQAAEKVKNRYK